MKEVKFYNVIFPIWILMFFPPFVIVTLIGNFIIDSLVVIACFFVFKLVGKPNNLKTFYKKSMLKVWVFGFLADFIGAAALLLFQVLGDVWGLPYELVSAISYDPFSHPGAVMIIIFAMLVSALFIFIFNYKFTFAKQIEEKKARLKVAITIAIVTMPWTFLLPTKWFYHGL